ncbi:MAG: outer membrane protein [Xanthobacteraceae bacterium]
MKRVILACAGLLVLAASAGAADLPRRYDPAPVRAPVYGLYNWTGFYIGINGGGGWGHSDWTSAGGFDLNGGLIGGTIGYNWQSGPMVFGLEGDIDWTNIKGSTTVLCGVACSTRNSWLATVRGRLGYSFDRFMPYVTGGLAMGDIAARVGGTEVSSDTNAGWTVGGGLEFAIAGNWTAKAEYLYVDLGDFNCGIACGVGNPDNVSFRTHIVRGGVNVRF